MTSGKREEAREYFGFGTKRMRELKVCGECGAMVDAHRRYCTHCHAKLPQKTLYDIYKSRHRACPNCGIVLSEHASYCPQCGKKQAMPPKPYQMAEKKIAL